MPNIQIVLNIEVRGEEESLALQAAIARLIKMGKVSKASPSFTPKRYTLGQAAGILQISEWKLRRAIYSGRLQATRDGDRGRIYLSPNQVHRLAQKGLPNFRNISKKEKNR